jgi:hypothetical protein
MSGIMSDAAYAAQEPIMSSDPLAAPSAPPRRAAPSPLTGIPRSDSPALAPDDLPDAAAAEPIAHERLPSRSDDN